VAASFTLRETITDPIVFTLKSVDPDTGVATAVDLTGVTKVELRLKSRDGSENLSFATDDEIPQLEVSDAENGEVTFSPGASDLDASEGQYDGYFKVTDAGGKIISFPSDESFQFVVIKAY
jgi:hypothetical protein